jgi:sugar diacid utilization regulator/putative methionine-R-sulfoxide reductase with GAF domain
MTVTRAGIADGTSPPAPPPATHQAGPPPGAAGVEEALCAAAASGSRDAVVKVLAEHLTSATGAGSVCIWRTDRGATEVLAGEPPRLAETGLEVVQAAAMTAALRGAGGLAAAARDPLERALRWAGTALRLLELADSATSEAAALQAAAAQILRVRDLEQVLLSINECTLRLLHSDICGIFLREDDELAMRGCVGNHTVQTARLRMRRGQGLAGLVFSTGTAGRVDNYLTDRHISQDFMSLAASEQTLSALAVPMRSHGDLIGVLEVWRRRASVFNDDDARRLEALAILATIAIDNARLYAAHEQSVAELRSAHAELAGKLEVVGRSAAVQRSLLATVLAGAGQAGIAKTLHQEVGCEVVILGDGHRPVALCPPGTDPGPLQAAVRKHGRRSGECRLAGDPGSPRTAWIQPIVVDGDARGHVCLVADGLDRDLLESAISQAAMACCLVELQQQAASRARTQACDEVLWDLLDGPSEQRTAAMSRAAALGISLPASMRVVHGCLDNLAEVARAEQWDLGEADRVRRQILRCIREHAPRRQLDLTAQRGDWIVGLTGLTGAADVRSLLAALSAAVAAQWPTVRIRWAVSAPGHEAADLPGALHEARAAMDAARRLAATQACLYDELGVVRLLVGGQEDPDMKKFVGAVAQPLLDYDAGHDGALLATLRAFLRAECSQRAAAEQLFIHPKTLRYRLEQIRALTGLDLSRHSDRVQADLALQLLEVARSVT